MTYGGFKDLKSRTFSDKVLRDEAFNIAKNPKYDGYQTGLASMVYKFFDKKSTGSGRRSLNFSTSYRFLSSSNNEIKQNIQLADELHKPIIKKFEKIKVFSSFRDNIGSADLADMQLLSKFIKRFRFLLCIIDICSKYVWVILFL